MADVPEPAEGPEEARPKRSAAPGPQVAAVLPPVPPDEAALALPPEIWLPGRLGLLGQLRQPGWAPQEVGLPEDGREQREPVACGWR